MAAFRKTKKIDPYAVADTAPKWANRTENNVAGTWTTYDPETDNFQYDSRYNTGQTEGKVFEDDDWLGPTAAPMNDDDAKALFTKKFIDEDSILDDRIAKSDFEVANAHYLGFGDDPRKRSTIINQIGDSYVAVKQMPDAGIGPRDQLKKSQIEEKRRRLEERNAEMRRLWPLFTWWRGLSDEEREVKRQEQREKARRLMENIRLHIVESMPDDVQGIGIDLANLDLDDTDSASSSTAPRSRASNRSSRPRSNRSRSPMFVQNFPLPSSRRDSYAASSRSTRPSSNSDSLAILQSYTLPSRPPTTSSRPAEAAFRVAYHPAMIPPPEDLDEGLELDLVDTSLAPMYERVVDINMRKPRVVTVRLNPKVTAPFAEAVTERVWGGLVQQIFFDPGSRHAVIIFIVSSGAAAFVDHWRAISRHAGKGDPEGVMELRRTQIAVDWYEGRVAESVLPVQPHVLQAICFNKACRVLNISGFDKSMKKNDAESGFRLLVGLDRVICRGRLVVPTKAYERVHAKSNQLVVEFASVRDAVDVREDINDERLGPDFRGYRAEFGRDPTDRPPVARDYCNCRWCRKSREGLL